MAYYFESDKIWKASEPDFKVVQKLQKETGLSKLTSIFLANRGINNSFEAKEFLNPSTKLLEEPDLIPDIKKAAQRIKNAIRDDELIYIFGDYDVDGITSTTLLFETLKKMKANVCYHIPCRFKEGYGLSKNAINKIAKKGAKLLVTVDCGIKSFSEIDYANKQGLEVIITDHHEPGETCPKAFAVVNPKLEHSEFENRDLAGVGVVLKLAQLLANDALENSYDLVALGTIADIAPLVKENRYLAKMGLSIINKSLRPGIAMLAKKSGIRNRKITSGVIGYTLAPRLNASGRVANASICVDLLTTNDEAKTLEIATFLEDANKKRREFEEKLKEEVIRKVEAEVNLDKEKIIFLADKGWHDGVKGIIASRIKEKFYRPTFIGTVKEGKIKASGRSIPNFSMHKALESCTDILDNFGGHEGAAGLTVSVENANKLKEKLNLLADKWLKADDLRPSINFEAKPSLEEFNYQLKDEMEKLEPFGEANRQPKILFESIYLKNQKRLGNKGNHLSLDLSVNERKIKTIAFGVDSFSTIFNHWGKADVIGQLDVNEFNSRVDIRFRALDFKLHSLTLDSAESVVEHLFANKEALAKVEEYKNIGDVDSFFTKLVGVTFNERQGLIGKIKANTPLVLKREPNNKHDPNAIRVLSQDDNDLGFLNKRLAKQLAPLMDSGKQFDCRVTDVTGGDDKNFGVNVIILQFEATNELDDYDTVKKKIFNDSNKALAEIKKVILKGLNFHQYQEATIKSLLERKNTLAIMGTGRGKSAVFQTIGALKALTENKMSVFLYPLKSLITDQYLFLREVFSKIGLNIVRMSGECSFAERQKLFKAMNEGRIDIVLTTPEFLQHNTRSFSLIAERIDFLVVDEAHHLSTATYSHRPIYKNISSLMSSLGNPLIMAATATANHKAYTKISESLNIEKTIIDPTVRKNLYIVDRREIKNKEAYILNLVKKSEKILIYVNSREKAAEIAYRLRNLAKEKKGEIVYYHAGLNSKLRLAVQEGFLNSTFKVVVATSAFGEGINIGDIEHVILYHLPFSYVEYNQQSGRCGRNGQKAGIHLLFSEDDARINEYILESKAPTRKILSVIWQLLSSIADKENKVFGSVSEICTSLSNEQPGIKISRQTIASGLKIFEELGLIYKGSENSKRIIMLNRNKRVKLTESVIYEEGLHEKQQFAEFKNWAFKSSQEALLTKINQPIYPRSDVRFQELKAREIGTVL